MTFAEWKIQHDMKGQYALASTDVWNFWRIFEDYPILTDVFVDHLFKQGYVLMDLSQIDSIYPLIVHGESFAKLRSYWFWSAEKNRAMFIIMDGDILIAGDNCSYNYMSHNLHPHMSTEQSIYEVRQRWNVCITDKQSNLTENYFQDYMKEFDENAVADYKDRLLKIDQFLRHRNKDPNWMTL